MAGTLYVVGTPIGNLSDLTFRAEKTLRAVNFIAAEDTRTCKKLLNHYNIGTPLIAYHDNNEIYQAMKLVDKLNSGDSIAIISDAGTPCISDPGYRVVNLAKKEKIEVISIPGPSAVTAALSVSGLPTDHFYFEGFLPLKKGRRSRFELLESMPGTVVIFESPHKVLRTLKDIRNYFGNRIISVCRELTKIFEESFLGKVEDAEIYFSKTKPKGEFVVLVAKKGYTLD